MRDRDLEYTEKIIVKEKEKYSKDKEWFKQNIDKRDVLYEGSGISDINFSSNERKKEDINYDLYNNILEPDDFKDVVKPFENDESIGELPKRFTNKDIISSRVKLAVDIHDTNGFPFKVIAVNEEATTRKEEARFGRIKKAVDSELEKKYKLLSAQAQQKQQDVGGQSMGQMSPQKGQKTPNKLEEKTINQTLLDIEKYMEREHQDPAEILSQQLLEYISEKEDLKNIFREGILNYFITSNAFFNNYDLGEIRAGWGKKILHPSGGVGFFLE